VVEDIGRSVVVEFDEAKTDIAYSRLIGAQERMPEGELADMALYRCSIAPNAEPNPV